MNPTIEQLRGEMADASLVCQIRRLARESYITLTAFGKFQRRDWHNLARGELEQLRAIVLNRRARRRRRVLAERRQLKLTHL